MGAALLIQFGSGPTIWVRLYSYHLGGGGAADRGGASEGRRGPPSGRGAAEGEGDPVTARKQSMERSRPQQKFSALRFCAFPPPCRRCSGGAGCCVGRRRCAVCCFFGVCVVVPRVGFVLGEGMRLSH